MIRVGDCLHLMAAMPADSVDAVVTDPPYGLSFMGKRWDYQVPGVDVWRECFRVLKPGGRLLAFAGTRTMHRMWCNIEDAGFTIEDSIAWMYGSGFPKHRSKLKPAYEPICVARKGPVSELNIDGCRIHAGERPLIASTPKNGALAGEFRLGSASAGTTTSGRWPANVILGHHEDCREVGTRKVKNRGGVPNATSPKASRPAFTSDNVTSTVHHFDADGTETVPAWECHPDCPVRLLDEQSGELHSQDPRTRMNGQKATRTSSTSPFVAGPEPLAYSDSGGASRFFYVAKASRTEREHGLETIEVVEVEVAWDNEVRKARLRVDTAQSPPRVIAASGMGDATEWSTFLFGSASTAPSLLGCRFTTAMRTSWITESATLSWLMRSLTSASIAVANSAVANGGSPAGSAEKSSASLTFTPAESVSLPPVGSVPAGAQLRISGNAGSPADHPTVKPVDLMRYLVRLVTPNGGTVLDPFAGSGTTGIACVEEGRGFIGCELSEEYAEIARRRIAAAQPTLFTDGAA